MKYKKLKKKYAKMRRKCAVYERLYHRSEADGINDFGLNRILNKAMSIVFELKEDNIRAQRGHIKRIAILEEANRMLCKENDELKNLVE